MKLKSIAPDSKDYVEIDNELIKNITAIEKILDTFWGGNDKEFKQAKNKLIEAKMWISLNLDKHKKWEDEYEKGRNN